MTVLEPEASAASPKWVRWLDDSGADDVDVLGGKIAQLAGLRAAGVPTPDGFAVGADAYVAAIAASGAKRELDDAIARFEADPTQAGPLCATCRSIVLEMDLPDELEREVTEAYDQLTLRRGEAYPNVAVRSSAIKEDAVDASGAGQYTTVLGVAGAEAVLAAIRECWASLFSEHAVLYRHSRGIPVAETPMAVGIIELVDARASGVAFSVHPVTGSPSRLVIESSFGWGEALVAGHVTPDHYEVARESLRVLSRRIGDKRLVSTWSDGAGGIQEREMPEILRSTPSLDDGAVARVATVLLEIETHLGHSVDVEWVWPKGSSAGPIIVQARPETVHRLTADELKAATAKRAPFDPLAFAFERTFGVAAGEEKS